MANLSSTPIAGLGNWGQTLPKGPTSWQSMLSQLGIQGLTKLLGSKVAQNVAAQAPNAFNQRLQGASQSGSGQQPSGSFWQSPAAAAGIQGLFGLGGGILGGIGQSKQQDANLADSAADRAQRQAAFEAELAQRKDEFNREQGRLGQENEMSDLLKRQQTGVEATQFDPLAQQKSRQRNALMASYMGSVSNIKGPDGSNGFQGTGGLQIPEGGFGSDVTDFFTPEARAAAEGQFYNTTAPFMDPTDLTQVGYGNAGTAPTASAKAARQSWYESELARKKASQTALMGALDPTKSTLPATANRPWLQGPLKTASRLLDNTGYKRQV